VQIVKECRCIAQNMNNWDVRVFFCELDARGELLKPCWNFRFLLFF
jgi:hypothetical protein